MNVYVFYTSKNEVLFREWFLPSFKDNYSIIEKRGSQGSASGRYKDIGWSDLVGQKVDFIIEAVKRDWGKLFVFSDPDILFITKINDHLSKIKKNQDILFQEDRDMICTGFFICRANKKTLKFWQNVRSHIRLSNADDQDCANYLLKQGEGLITTVIAKVLQKKSNEWRIIRNKMGDNRARVKWDYLSKQFYSPGRDLDGKVWNQGKQLSIPKNIVLYHANWTIGTENKIQHLKIVKRQLS